jgi:hypothetical protein
VSAFPDVRASAPGLSRDLLRAAFRDYFGVADEHADLLIFLYERPYDRIPTREMQALLGGHRAASRSVVYERVRVLREAMEAESLDSGGRLDGMGYALSEVGLAECRQALCRMAEALNNAAPEGAARSRRALTG